MGLRKPFVSGSPEPEARAIIVQAVGGSAPDEMRTPLPCPTIPTDPTTDPTT